jgi:hypothetical protein
MVILSVPKLLAGREPYILPFSALQEQNSSTETTVGAPQSFGGDAVVPDAPVPVPAPMP